MSEVLICLLPSQPSPVRRFDRTCEDERPARTCEDERPARTKHTYSACPAAVSLTPPQPIRSLEFAGLASRARERSVAHPSRDYGYGARRSGGSRPPAVEPRVSRPIASARHAGWPGCEARKRRSSRNGGTCNRKRGGTPPCVRDGDSATGVRRDKFVAVGSPERNRIDVRPIYIYSMLTAVFRRSKSAWRSPH